jgi:IclR family transcriptional regulator, KDG regulon repressor
MVPSVARAIGILDYLAKHGRAGLSRIAKDLSIPKSTAFSILESLEKGQLVEKEPSTLTFCLGIRLLELGQEAQQNFELRRVASPFLREWNREIDETVHLTVLDGEMVLYVECFESSKRLRTYSVIGVRAPLHCTAVGKALLAFLEEEERARLIARMRLERFTANTITDRGSLLADLALVRRRGYAVDDVEHEEGVRCAGAPIFDNRGRVCASISVSGPTQRITARNVGIFARQAMATASKISTRLGYRP